MVDLQAPPPVEDFVAATHVISCKILDLIPKKNIQFFTITLHAN
jgi:hypothetical protein